MMLRRLAHQQGRCHQAVLFQALAAFILAAAVEKLLDI